MAIFSAIIAMLPAVGTLTIFGLGAQASAAIIGLGKAALWSLASYALNQPKVPRQTVMATISQTDQPRIRAYGRNLLGGVRVFFEASGGNLKQIVVIHHGQVDGLIRFWREGEPVVVEANGKLQRYIYLWFRDGSGAGGTYPDVTEQFPTLWTAAHRLQNQATFCIHFGDPSDEDFAKIFPQGERTLIQAEIRGVRLRNMAGDLVYSENAGLCLRDLLTHQDGWRIPLANLNTASWQAFVNLCNQPVTRAAGGTEPRYRLCGYYTLDDALKDVTERMLATCDGQIYETAEGQVGILGGAWSVPDVTITADDILHVEMKDGYDPFTDYNVLKGSFVSPEHSYQPTEVAERRDELALVTHPERVQQLDIDMCPSGGQMQRLMKIREAKDRREYVGTIRTNLVGMKARFPKGDGVHTIRIIADEFSLNGVFEVTSHTFSVPDGFCEIGIASLANPYGWNPATEEKPVQPGLEDIPRPNASTPLLGNFSLTQEIVTVSAGVRGVKLVVKTSSGREGVELRAQVAKGSFAAEGPWAGDQPNWVEMPASSQRMDVGGLALAVRHQAESGILDDGATYTVRIRWKGYGSWVQAGVIKVVANAVQPAAPIDFGAVATGSNVYLDWRNPGSNYNRTQIWKGSSFATATLVDTVYGLAGRPASCTDPIPPFSPPSITYWAVTLNASGVSSDPAGPVMVLTD